MIGFIDYPESDLWKVRDSFIQKLEGKVVSMKLKVIKNSKEYNGNFSFLKYLRKELIKMVKEENKKDGKQRKIFRLP